MKPRFRFLAVHDNQFDGWIEYVPAEEAKASMFESFSTYTAAKHYLRARWLTNMDRLRDSIHRLRQIRRTEIVRRGMKRARLKKEKK